MKTLFLIWRSINNNRWYPIGKLTNSDHYHFEYVQGVLEAEKDCGFKPLESFPSFKEQYSSDDLFPLFKNRVLQKNRPDYKDYINYLNLKDGEDDPIAILGRSAGRRETDFFELFPLPERDSDGKYHIHFFVRGISHLPKSSLNRINELKENERLILVHDFQNKYDENAFMLRTDDSSKRFEKDLHILGYLPRFLTKDMLTIKNQGAFEVYVERVNKSSIPSQFRLLCNMTADWPISLKPFSSNIFASISSGS